MSYYNNCLVFAHAYLVSWFAHRSGAPQTLTVSNTLYNNSTNSYSLQALDSEEKMIVNLISCQYWVLCFSLWFTHKPFKGREMLNTEISSTPQTGQFFYIHSDTGVAFYFSKNGMCRRVHHTSWSNILERQLVSCQTFLVGDWFCSWPLSLSKKVSPFSHRSVSFPHWLPLWSKGNLLLLWS